MGNSVARSTIQPFNQLTNGKRLWNFFSAYNSMHRKNEMNAADE